MAEAKKTDPDLWEKVKEEVTKSDKGGDPGQWSARKAQLAVQEYKRRGGGYADDGPSQEETDLHDWTEEDWGTKSGGKSGATGERYLPRQVRMILTEDDYARSTQKKKDGSGQYVDQPEDVEKKVAQIKSQGPTKEMLAERARDLGIEGRSGMNRDKLLDAIDAATDENGRGKGSRAALDAMTADELHQMAQDRDIQGRSSMTKDELVAALAEHAPDDLASKTKDELYEMAQERDIDGRSNMSRDDLEAALRTAG